MLAKTPEIFCIALLSCALVSCASVDVCGQRIDSLEHSSWEHSEWISVVDAPVVQGGVISSKNNRAADGASCFLSELYPKSKVLSAKWMTAGLGVYELYVNGHLIGAEILKPGFTDNSKTKYSFTYDITDVFNCNKGQKNTLFAQVTPGWWGDKIVTPHGYDGMLGRKCAFRGVLELTFEDGTKQLFGTDSLNWKAGLSGPVKHAAIFDGEIYDARELPGYLSSENFSTPEINCEFAGEILPSDGAEVYLLDELSLKTPGTKTSSGNSYNPAALVNTRGVSTNYCIKNNLFVNNLSTSGVTLLNVTESIPTSGECKNNYFYSTYDYRYYITSTNHANFSEYEDGIALSASPLNENLWNPANGTFGAYTITPVEGETPTVLVGAQRADMAVQTSSVNTPAADYKTADLGTF